VNSLQLTAPQLRLNVSQIALIVCNLLYLLGNTMNLEQPVVSRISSSSESYIMTDGQSACLGIKHPSGAYDQIFITVRQFRVC
jgi:hypothetical protein